MIEVLRYSSDKKEEWDEFVSTAKNGTFLFLREYMEYHSDRFIDYSMLLYENGRLKSIFPGNRVNKTFYSHQGLTFGGILITSETNSLKFIEYTNAYNHFLNSNGINEAFYKCIPQIYKSDFGDEELYAMYRLNAEVTSCNLSSCLNLSNLSLSRNRKRNYLKSLNSGVTTKKSSRWDDFWHIMSDNLQNKYHTKPVHSLAEIKRLHILFPNHIELLETCIDERMIGGAVIYKYKNVLKIQYAHASEEGKVKGAIDNLYNQIFQEYKHQFSFVDFGTSNEHNGQIINEGLLNQKESFGARAVNFYTYGYNTINTI